MGKLLAILGGLIAMGGGVILVYIVWWNEFKTVVFGCIPPILFLIGLVALISGISGVKDCIRSKKVEKEEEKTE
jgi:hypothetical protein